MITNKTAFHIFMGQTCFLYYKRFLLSAHFSTRLTLFFQLNHRSSLYAWTGICIPGAKVKLLCLIFMHFWIQVTNNSSYDFASVYIQGDSGLQFFFVLLPNSGLDVKDNLGLQNLLIVLICCRNFYTSRKIYFWNTRRTC